MPHAMAQAFFNDWAANHTRVVNVYRNPLERLSCQIHGEGASRQSSSPALSVRRQYTSTRAHFGHPN